MTASVYLACQNAAHGGVNSTTHLTADTPRPDTLRALDGGILILGKTSVPLYAIRQHAPEDIDTLV